MTALAFADRRGWEDAGRRGVGAGGADEEARPAQPRLFALPGGAVEEPVAEEVTVARLAPPAPAPPVPQPPAAVAAPAVAPVRTLDEVLTGAWSAVAAGQTAACPLCDGPLRPRWSAGHGAVGGRCADCGTVVD
jgi:hypothetical protein